MISYKDFNPHNRLTLPVYSKYVVDPLARLIAMPVINYTAVKPYQVTILGLGLGGLSAYHFYQGSFLLGALIFQLTVVLDMVDGYVARIKQNGSVFGILLDGYSDLLRLYLNILALVIHFGGGAANTTLPLMTFLFLSTAEAHIDFELINVRKFLSRNEGLSLNALNRFMLKVKNGLESVGLRTIFLYVQERIFCVLFLGPVTGNIEFWTIVGIGLVLVSIHMKMLLDVALIKNTILNNSREELR